jgi:hypothetical protein
MLGRRRQSIHGGFAPVPSLAKGFAQVPSSPAKGFGGFGGLGRNLPSREGRPTPSPRASSTNLRESPSRDNRLSSLVESPIKASSAEGGSNGINTQPPPISDVLPATPTSHPTNSTNPWSTSNVTSAESPPPPGPPPSHLKPFPESRKDSEGFTVPAARNDPISQAQQEAAQESDQLAFKLAIQNEPIPEQDSDAQAALSNVANTLRFSQAVTPTRKLGTVRGRRDVRNTIYAPQSLDLPMFENQLPPPSPVLAVPVAKAATLPSLSAVNHHAAPSTSDTTSIRSGHSLTNNVLVKHAEMHEPGLNASIIETVSVTFANGAAQTAKVNGEVALVYNKAAADDILPSRLLIFT